MIKSAECLKLQESENDTKSSPDSNKKLIKSLIDNSCNSAEKSQHDVIDLTSEVSCHSFLGKKHKKANRESCSICRDGGNLLLCDNCPRSFHLDCLKLKEADLPSGAWFCPTCR